MSIGAGLVPIIEHMFLVADRGVQPPPVFPTKNGLVAVSPGVAVIFAGISIGVVAVRVEVHREVPPVKLGSWEEVVEVTLEAPEGHLAITGLGADAPDGLPGLSPAGPGLYRLRVHASGRDIATDIASQDPVEQYLIQTWSASLQPEQVLRQTDRYGAGLRATEWPLEPVVDPPSPAASRRAMREANLRRARPGG